MSDPQLAKLEYSQLLDRILRTNPEEKAVKFMEKAIGLKFQGKKSKPQPQKEVVEEEPPVVVECSLSKALKLNKSCIESTQSIRDNLLGAFLTSSESGDVGKEEIKRILLEAVGNIINLVSEAVSLSRKLNKNAMGLYVAVDFLRNPKDLEILDFSPTGRIPISHFSQNEATAMCLTWLCNSAENLIKNDKATTTGKSEVEGVRGPAAYQNHDHIRKIYTSFRDAVLSLRDSAQLASQVFRVLLYCNANGKQMLKDYLASLKREEINDIIVEVQMLRRQFEEITILFEKLGWSLSDIWSKCTGARVDFENLQMDGYFGKVAAEKTEGVTSKTSMTKLAAGDVKQVVSLAILDNIKDFKKTKKDTKFIAKLSKVFGKRAVHEKPPAPATETPEAESSKSPIVAPVAPVKYKTSTASIKPKLPKGKLPAAVKKSKAKNGAGKVIAGIVTAKQLKPKPKWGALGGRGDQK